MKTNFDKWKEGLSPDAFISGNFSDFISIDEKCPARMVCPKGGEYSTCAKEFLKWANAETKEDEMATNFEKWRDSLTPETYMDIPLSCGACPALHECDLLRKYGHVYSCRESFLRWANAPAKEEKEETK